MKATTEHWNTLLGGYCQGATTYYNKFETLDFLSEDARRSLVYRAADALLCAVGTIDAARLHPDAIWVYEDYVVAGVANHALGGVLSEPWVRAFTTEFLEKIREFAWNHVYRENEWFDERIAREAAYQARVAEQKAREVEQARKILEKAGQ